MRKLIAISIVVVAFAGSFAVRHILNMPSEETSPATTETRRDRIICLSPGLTETAFALGLGDRVVGVTRYCLYPLEAQERPDIGGFLDPNYEAIVALRPDVVLVTPYQQELARDLQRLGVTICTVTQDSLKDILESYAQIGALCDCQEEATALADTLKSCLAHVAASPTNDKHPRVLMTTGRDVRSGTLNEVYAVGRGTFLDEIITLLGGENIAPGNLLEYPSLSAEGILRLDPDILIELVADQEYDQELEATALAAWNTLPNFRVAQEKRIHVLFGNYLTIPGPRVVLTLEALARCLRTELDETL
jgi:iron complex transport system substrate-binding protein